MSPGRPPAVEIPLLGGTANRGRVHRVRDTVRRPLRPTSAATHALLRHLEEVGFDGAPRVLGIDEAGREVLSYVPGEAVTAPAPGWGLTDAALDSVGRLLRRFHDAVAGLRPEPVPLAGLARTRRSTAAASRTTTRTWTTSCSATGGPSR